MSTKLDRADNVGSGRVQIRPYWADSSEANLNATQSSWDGLSSAEAASRLQSAGANSYRPKKTHGPIEAFLGQFKNSIVLLLIAATVLSLIVGDFTNAVIIFVIILASAVMGFLHEYRASTAVNQLLAMVETKVTVTRDKSQAQVNLEDTVKGDVVVLSAGSMIPADGLVLAANNLFVDQASLTGESFPAEKKAGVVPADADATARTNCVFSGTHVTSGSGKMLAVRTGSETEYGQIIDRLSGRSVETDFERGVRRFGTMLLEVTLILTISVFAINVYFHRPVLESFMFAVALAVGLTPQLLTAIISVNLAHGAQRMAQAKVIVKRLNAIENFGSMNLLCSDKTGTLTLGIVQVQAAYDPSGAKSDSALHLARLNSHAQTGFVNPIDEALLAGVDLSTVESEVLGEIPYDFTRKRLTVILKLDGKPTMVTKGALDEVLAVCATARTAQGTEPLALSVGNIRDQFASFCAEGLRVLGIATRVLDKTPAPLNKECEADMCFEGLLVLGDPLRPDIVEAIARLADLGVGLKVITGDNYLAARHLGESLKLDNLTVLRGKDIRGLSDAALIARAQDAQIFAEIEPNQKERLILAFKRAGKVVGYIGDGINDGTALHAADVGISVANAVPVAKEAADIVMLEPGLGVLVNAVEEGRRTFANTLKYIYMASSANFGNMFSMAGASLFLPFLPLLPKQVLLNNLLTDAPEMTLAADNVDEELVQHPRSWDVAFLKKFMLVFGLISSVADFATFFFLLQMRASPALFRTAWFVESVLSATMAVFVVRSRRPIFRTRPGRQLIWAAAASLIATFCLPLTPLGRLLGFVPLPLTYLEVIFAIVLAYIVVAEVVKHWFYEMVKVH
jgi:Mg2+-importing ATPase